MIIGVAGLAGSGKSEIGKILREHGWYKTAFAETLKEAAGLIYDLDYEQLYGNLKETIDLRYELSPRFIMQRFGTEVVRSIHPETWVMAVENRITHEPKGINWVIDDVRFPNEVEAVHRWGGQVWMVERPGLIGNKEHASEDTGLIKADLTIHNDGSIVGLNLKVRELIK